METVISVCQDKGTENSVVHTVAVIGFDVFLWKKELRQQYLASVIRVTLKTLAMQPAALLTAWNSWSLPLEALLRRCLLDLQSLPATSWMPQMTFWTSRPTW